MQAIHKLRCKCHRYFDFHFRTPALHFILTTALIKKGKLNQEKATSIISVISKIAHISCLHLSAYAKMVGLSLRTSGTTKSQINRMSKLYDCVSYTRTTKILDDCAGESKSLIEAWKGIPVTHCGDNLDVRAKVRHEAGGISGFDCHMYNNMIYKLRFPVMHLSPALPYVPRKDDLDYSQFLLSDSEEEQFKNLMASQILASWRQNDLTTATPSYPPNKYSSEMSSKSQKLSILSICLFMLPLY